jgi:hypothetical protein
MRSQVAVVAGLCVFAGAAFAKAEDRDVPAFDSVQIEGGLRATIEIGPRRPVHLEGPAEVLAMIETVVEDGSLRVGFKPDRHWHGHHDGEVKVTIQTPDLRNLGASGGSIVRARLTRSDKTEIAASGGSELHLRGIDAAHLVVNGSGGSTLELAGSADDLDLQMSGGTQLHGRELSVRNVDLQGSGGSQGDLRASGKIRGGLSGGSQLHVRGGASARVSTSGGSSVEVD